MKKLLISLAMLAFALSCYAQNTASNGALVSIPTRPNVSIAYWWMSNPQASHTLLLFSGGGGGIGYQNGAPASSNFLIRTRDEFYKAGFNVALIGNPSDERSLSYAFRSSANHMLDIQAVLNSLKREAPAKPIWLVGTSRGTSSVTSAAIALPKQFEGIVLTAMITAYGEPSSPAQMDLEKITIPTLIHHHKDDSCKVTLAYEAKRLATKFTMATPKKYIEVTGGSNIEGHPCEALHYHGYRGIENDVIKQISDWIKSPLP